MSRFAIGFLGRKLQEYSFGTYLNAVQSNRGVGPATGLTVAGFFFTAPNSGEIRRVIWEITSGGDGANFHNELWSVSGNNPLAQIGSDTPTVAAANGDNVFVWASPRPHLVKGREYCCVLVSTGGDGNFTTVAPVAAFGSDRHTGTITSLNKTNDIGVSEDWRVEVVAAR